MRTIETTAYAFDELSEDAKDKAIENLSDINVRDFEWWDSLEDQVFEDLETLGCSIPGKREIFFDIDRGSYLSFNARLTLADFILTVEKLEIDKLPQDLQKPVFSWASELSAIRPMLKKLIVDTGQIEVWASAGHGSKGIRTDSDSHFCDGGGENIEKFASYWANELEDVLKSLSEIFLSRLKSEYEYLTSKEAIVEIIKANEYEFTEDGELA